MQAAFPSNCREEIFDQGVSHIKMLSYHWKQSCFNMNLTTLGELSWFLWAILLYNTATAIAEGILIPVNISCHPSIRLDTDDRIFSLKLHICNITITVDNDEPRVTRFSDLWNVSVIGNFSRKPFVEGGGHVDCSMVTCNIKCAIYGYFLGMEYVSQFYTPHIEYGVVSKTIKKAPEMLICEAVSGPTTRNMRWQNKTGGGMFKDIPTVIEHEQDTCLTTSKLKYDGNVQAQYRCMFGDIEVGSTRVSGKDIDLSVHFFWSTMIILKCATQVDESYSMDSPDFVCNLHALVDHIVSDLEDDRLPTLLLPRGNLLWSTFRRSYVVQPTRQKLVTSRQMETSSVFRGIHQPGYMLGGDERTRSRRHLTP
ncbi:uncharacterized protein [Haliotis asinina]|uniref:uncharacterized protein isoform X3 n=1 Tax=Haliotis asinina TaxID=109174 RepID=UPI003532723C